MFNNEIPSAVREWCESHVSGGKTFASYLEYVEGEIVERIFAARKYKQDGLLITEVIRESTGNCRTVCRNLLYSRMQGYTPIFKAKDVYYRSGGYPYKVFGADDFNIWEDADFPLSIWKAYVNPELVTSIEQFKYCGYSSGDVVHYIKKWREDNSLEIFGKLGIPLYPTLIKKAKSDKQFRRFLWEHHTKVEEYGAQAFIYAYKHKMSIEKAKDICYMNNQFNLQCARLVPDVKGTKIDRARLLDYLYSIDDENGHQYNDYLKAIKDLQLDLNDTKNTFPKDFRRMHDLRTAEWQSKQAEIDERKRKKLYEGFAERGKEYSSLSYEGEMYSVLIPQSIAELKNEGEVLSHCVGKMGYDKKVVDGISIIAFIRKNTDKATPFVTVEYRLDENKIRQCYGFKDSRPAQDVIDFSNQWGEMVKNTRKEKTQIGRI